MDMPTPSEVAAVLQELDVPKPLRGQFFMGFQVEWEHAHTVDYDLLTVGKIVLDHLEENPKYYTKLRKIHRENPMRQPEDREGFRFAVIEHERPDGAFKGRIILAAYDDAGRMLAWIGAVPARTKPYNEMLGLHEWNIEPQDKAWEVGQTHAWEDGWGPLMYEALIVFLVQKGYSGWLLNDPHCTSREARAVWQKFSQREDVDFIELPARDHHPRFAIRARPELLARREKLVKKPDTDRIRKRLVKAFLKSADETGVYDTTIRQNPFLPKVDFYGQSSRFKEWEGGFHVADTLETAVPYAQQKWKTGPFGERDFPVIVELDVTGFPILADIDARRAALGLFRDAVTGVDNLFEFLDRVEQIAEIPRTPEDFQVGDNADSALFSCFSISNNPVAAARVLGADFTEQDFALFYQIGEKLLREGEEAPLSREEDEFLVAVFGQARFMVPITDARILRVLYMAPYFPTVVFEEQFDEEAYGGDAAVLEAADEGYNFVEIDYPEQSPSTSIAWQRPVEDLPMGFEAPVPKRTMYHGTSLSNLLRAAPWLSSKLAPPPSPQKGGIRGLVRAMRKK